MTPAATVPIAAATTSGSLPPVICTILLVAMIIALIVGLAEAIGLLNLTGNRFHALLVAIVLVVVFVVAC